VERKSTSSLVERKSTSSGNEGIFSIIDWLPY